MEENSSIQAHKSVFVEGMCYRMTIFVVRREGKGVHRTFHIFLLKSSIVERIWELLPMHSFNVMSVLEFASCCSWELGIIGELTLI